MSRTKLTSVGGWLFLLTGLAAGAAPAARTVPGQDTSLEAVLAKAQTYCARLDGIALDFACREEVKEKTNTRSRPQGISMQNTPTFVPNKPGALRVAPAPSESFLTTTYLYDYRYTRGASGVQQKRDLVKKSGDDLEEFETRVKSVQFAYIDIFFGPSALLGQAAAERHRYALLKTEKIKGQRAAVIECAPKDGSGARTLSGLAWVRLEDGAVLKIEWDPTSFVGWKEITAVADEFKMKPKFKSTVEFRVEQNGLRFPSEYVSEEAYDGGGSLFFTRAATTTKFEDYKFFTVETEIPIRRP